MRFSWKKKLFISSVSLLILISLSLVFFSLFFAEDFLKKALEKRGGEILGTKVEVSAVRISFLKGQGSLCGLSVDNPVGFNKRRKIFKLKEITFNFSLSHLLTKPFEVENIFISC